ncbi:capsular polysaccharide biosynthesis protein [Sinirhodobacter populi]|uniref:Capsular polysaccharide biosynthesis protein n=1 Tax=Paenirhodobacter populi TaxID=2306993 RepID=A0A443K9P8_9RHOB|nr:capsular polysaccharide biosynthesis protein [Sinirhodobacter populi]RWR29393.1 capsular polysaccharide biosynthesis protein [Sinirhodobacter populi]
MQAPGGRLFCYTAGFLRDPGLRRILAAAGWSLHFGLPGTQDRVVVWGRSPYARRGEAVARWRGVGIVRIEDAFLRSVQPGRARRGGSPLGLFIDPIGVHYDASAPSALEHLLATADLDDPALLARAEEGIARLRALDLSKYNDFDERLPAPEPGYVLVVDQTRGDASIRHGDANADSFRQMLAAARRDHPDARIVIRAHPETRAGLRPGHFGLDDADARTVFCTDPISPWRLLDGASAVYAVTSQLGYEAILAGHRPVLFGQPFYAGWGLSQDIALLPRRGRHLIPAQLFAVSHILAPTWFDPCRNRPCSFEEAVDQLEAETRAFRMDRAGHIATGIRLWKRRPLQHVFGRERPLRFVEPPARAVTAARASGRSLLVWGDLATDGPVLRVEDGFLRSRGLGADLVPPLSLIADARGIYYDPARPSDLEALIAQEPPPGGRVRTERLVTAIRAAGLSKYNLGGALPDLPEGHRILVPGQVEDDASIRLGAGMTCTNLALLTLVRAENPNSVIIFKPHPDVEAGLRPGRIPPDEALRYADHIADHADPIALIEAVDEVWTMTSLIGFEALLRGKPVTVTGAPFYAGWGLTRDLGPVPERRQARPDLMALAHAALIACPRYYDPVSRRPCPPEVVVERLSQGTVPNPGIANRMLAKLQGLFAAYTWIWRRQR